MHDLPHLVTNVLARRRLPIDSLGELLRELRREGRALTASALVRLLDGTRDGPRLLRPWSGLLAPLAPGGSAEGAWTRRRAGVREPGGAGYRTTSPGRQPEHIVVVGRDRPWGPDGREPCWPRVARAVLHLSRELDEASVLDRARWLQIHVEAQRLAA